MSHLDQLNNDLLAVIAQRLPIKELLYFIRSHRRLHTLDKLKSSSWSSRAFEYSHVSISLCKGFEFHDWLMKSHDYVYSNESKTSRSNNRPLYKGFISLSTWQLIKHDFYYVVNRWLNEHGDEMKDWYCHFCSIMPDFETFDIELAKNIVKNRDNPPTTIIMLDTGEECEVLTELNEIVLKLSLHSKFAPCYRPHLILSATPNVRALSFGIDATLFPTPQFNDLIGLVPNLRSLTLQQCNRDNNCKVDILRETMKYLSEIESLTIDSFKLSIQDLIDISSHPRLKSIKLDDANVNGEGMRHDEWEWFRCSYKFNSEQSQNHEHNDKINISQEIADGENNEIFEKAAMNEFRVDGDEGAENFNDQNNNPYFDAWKPEKMSADIKYIQSTLLLPSSAESIKARLKLINPLRISLFCPQQCEYHHPLRYLRHLRHQIYLLHSSLTKALLEKTVVAE